MKCPRCGGLTQHSVFSKRTWWCLLCDLEWDWTTEDGIIGYWSRSDRESGWGRDDDGSSDVEVFEVPVGTLPVFELGGAEE